MGGTLSLFCFHDRLSYIYICTRLRFHLFRRSLAVFHIKTDLGPCGRHKVTTKKKKKKRENGKGGGGGGGGVAASQFL